MTSTAVAITRRIQASSMPGCAEIHEPLALEQGVEMSQGDAAAGACRVSPLQQCSAGHDRFASQPGAANLALAQAESPNTSHSKGFGPKTLGE